ncbi:MAG: DNA primase [Burkholderiales bacterium]
MIPQPFIQDLLHRVDIVDVVDRHVKLKRAGANYVACCPFHSEKSPSFTVSPTKQFYHCFGCGAHGTAIGFVMEYSGIGFIEAVKDLAQSVGMTVPQEERSEHSQRHVDAAADVYAVLLTAAHFYRRCLKDAPRAIEYLKRRGLSGEIAKHFGIGYAPDGWQSLAAAFPDYNAKSLAAAGLVKQSEEGRRYDLFRDRIVFPIVDVRGNVIGFGGRVLDSGEPKYLNSPETSVFEKGRELYGLYQARRSIRDAGRALVVEGYMDVVALAQHGVGYSVATLGTATTAVHVQKLLRQVDEVVFCFDGDTAGRRAAWRALEVALPELADGKEVRFLFLPQGEDPDSYVRAKGKEGFEALVAAAVPLSRYLLEELSAQTDLTSAEGRARLVHAAKPLLVQLRESGFRVQLVRELARQAQLDVAEVETLCGVARPRPRTAAPVVRPRSAAYAPLWRQLLRLFIDNPQLADSVTAAQSDLLRTHPEFEPVAALVDAVRATGVKTTGALLEATRGFPSERLYGEIAQESVESPSDLDIARRDVEGVFGKLEASWVEQQLRELVQKADRTHLEVERLHQLGRRLAELKGAQPVGGVPPA